MDEATAPPFDPVRHSRGGRPRKRPEERRGEFVGVWLTADELARLDEAVTAARAVSRGDYLRAVALSGHGAAVVPPPKRRARSIAPIVAQLGRLGGLLHQCVKAANLGHFTPETDKAARETINALGDYLRKLATDRGDDPET